MANNDNLIRMQYMGVLQLLGNVMAYVPNTEEGREWQDAAMQAYDDAMAVIPGLKVRRSMSRYDLEMIPENQIMPK